MFDHRNVVNKDDEFGNLRMQKHSQGVNSPIMEFNRTPPPRSIEDTHPNRISDVWNVATPMKSTEVTICSKSTARKT